MITTLLATADPATFQWSPKCAVVMIACNVLAYAIARANIAKPNVGFEESNRCSMVVFKSLRKIKKGEELLINYDDF